MRIIVAGAGESGIVVGAKFSHINADVVLVDRNPAALRSAEEHLDVMTFVGDVTHREVLRRLDAGHADAFIAVTGSDSDNLVAASLAKGAGAGVAIARVDDPRFFEGNSGVERGVLGIDVTVCATRLAAAEILNHVTDVQMESVWNFADHGVRCAVAPVGDASELIGRSPRLLELAERVKIAAVIRGGFVRATADTERIEGGDRLLVVGDSRDFLRAWEKLYPEVRQQRALIVGGGDVGSILAPALAPSLDRVDLVEVEPVRAEHLAAELTGVRVLCGDARRSEFLRDVQVESVDYLLAVTADNETNLLVALLARQLGARSVFTLLRQAGHTDLFKELKVDAAVVFEVLGRSIPEMAIQDGWVCHNAIPQAGYEILEWRLPATLASDKPLSVIDLPLVAGAIFLGTSRRGELTTDSTGSALRGGESLLIAYPAREQSAQRRRLQRLTREMKA